MFHVKHQAAPCSKFCYGHTMAWNETELRASLLAVGPLVPVIVWRGVTLDGRRREKVCAEEGIFLPQNTFHTLELACQALWTMHPERAIQVAREHRGGHEGLPPTVRELAELCGVSVTAVSLVLKEMQPAKPQGRQRSPRRTRSIKTEIVKFYAEPQWKHYVRLTGAERGMDLSQTIRVACWEYVQKHLRKPPTEGQLRAPSVEHVRPPKR
jgi:hypothetical protein